MENGGAKFDGINALMYGAGSISGVVGYELSRKNVKKLYIANRSVEKAEEIAKILRENTPMETEVITTDRDALDRAAKSVSFLQTSLRLACVVFRQNTIISDLLTACRRVRRYLTALLIHQKQR